jgi:uncharacterized protein
MPNRLIHEKSPYLQQHAYNPVNWYPWSPEAFELARREDKPIFLSIGYSTCHWCHVMEHESFEDPDVAAVMNESFVSVKVDREERPDVDNVYMKVCQLVTGSGGWPLTIIMTPDQRPFFAATYIPKENRLGHVGLLDLIPRIRRFWTERRSEVESSSGEIVAALQRISSVSAGSAPGAQALDATFEALSAQFDPQYGGFGRSMKFPTPHTLLFLLRYSRRHHNAHAMEMVEKTLEAMRCGGIYDHVGFGFHRYSTDSQWHVPHFEKMLYDQALLVLAYAEAFQATRRDAYQRTAREVLEYVSRVMTSPEGGFYSAEDADSEGVEGKFYLWNEREIEDLLTPAEARLVIRAFGVTAQGNFEESDLERTNILHLVATQEEVAPRLGIPEQEWRERWAGARATLFETREKRVHPHKDDKILTDWNGLMLAAFARAAQVFDAPEYASAAVRCADFLLNSMRSSAGGLLHRYRAGEAAIEGHLDDYAFLVWGLIELYEATFDPRWLERALELNSLMVRDFWDSEHSGFYFTSERAESILVRSKEFYDGAVPSGNSVAILNLLRLARMTGRTDLEKKAELTALAVGPGIRESAAAHTLLMTALDFALGPSFEVVIAGEPGAEDTQAMLQALRRAYVPNKVVLLRPSQEGGGPISRLAPFVESQASLNGKATAYVCRDFQCQHPTADIAEMLSNLGCR